MSPGPLRSLLVVVWLLGGGAATAAGVRPAPPGQETASGTSLSALRGSRRYVAAIGAADRLLAQRYRSLGPDHPLTAQAFLDAGDTYRWTGHYEPAEALLNSAARRFERMPGREAELAKTLQSLGGVQKDTGRLEESETTLRRAVRILEPLRSPDDPDLVAARTSLAHTLRRLGRNDEAESLFRSALAAHESRFGSESVEVGEDLTWFGWFLSRLGRSQEAERVLREAADVLEKSAGPHDPRSATPRGFLARLQVDAGRIEEARDLLLANRSTYNLAEYPPPLDLHMSRLGYSGSSLAEVDLLLGRGDEAWEAIAEWEGWISRTFAGLDRIQNTSADPGLTTLRRRSLAALRRLETARREAGPADPACEAALIDYLEAEAGRLIAADRIMFRGDGFQATTHSLDEIQSTLGPHEAILGWLHSPWYDGTRKSFWAYVIRSEGPVTWVPYLERSPVRLSEWWGPALELRKIILRDSGWPNRLPAGPRIDRLAREVWSLVMAPVVPHLAGVDRLVVVTGNWYPGTEVPIECLRDPGGEDLIDRFQVSYTPSASLLVDLAAGPSAASSGRALLVGDPDFSGAAAEPALAAASPPPLEVTILRSILDGSETTVRSLPRLPHARDEILSIAALFPGSTVLLGSRASEKSLARLSDSGALRTFQIVHIATHALFDPSGDVERSALVLTPAAPGEENFDQLLTAQEAFLGLDLGADLVTLSGCQTGAGFSGANSERLGFTQALFRAGARSILMSEWKVDDTATERLMRRFYENWRGGSMDARDRLPGDRSKVAALHEAKLWLRDFTEPDGSRPFAHPAYWAGFDLIGNPN